jgi:hypothetical protein
MEIDEYPCQNLDRMERGSGIGQMIGRSLSEAARLDEEDRHW